MTRLAPPLLLWVALASGAAFALIALTPGCEASGVAGPDPGRANDGRDEGRAKGLRPHLVVHRKVSGRIERLPSGTSARAGDLVQLSYVAAGNHHGVVVSIDGSGTVTLHHPPTRFGLAADTRLDERGEHPLPTAFELDDAPNFERFFFVTSGDRPTDIDLVLDAARRRAQDLGTAVGLPLDLPHHLSQASVTILKAP